LQLGHSSEFNKLRRDVTARSYTVQYNELHACAAFVTIRLLLTKPPCNVTLQYTVCYKSIMNIIITGLHSLQISSAIARVSWCLSKF